MPGAPLGVSRARDLLRVPVVATPGQWQRSWERNHHPRNNFGKAPRSKAVIFPDEPELATHAGLVRLLYIPARKWVLAEWNLFGAESIEELNLTSPPRPNRETLTSVSKSGVWKLLP